MDASDTTEPVRRRTLDELMAESARMTRVQRGRNLIVAAIFIAIVAFTYRKTEFDAGALFLHADNMGRVLNGFSHPDTTQLPIIIELTLVTLYTAILGTTIGALIAVPLSFFGARNLMRRNPVGTAAYFIVRFLMAVIRSIPTLFWGILWVIVIGIGPFAGVLAVTTFSVGLISKLFSESIEAVDWGPVEALTATGANPIQVVVHGVIPQVLPYMIANILYSFEVNVHSSTILGAVGAGGLGLILLEYIGLFEYPQLAMLLIVVIVMTSTIDYSSAAIRRRII
ncbi:MAG TPA: phosphonate ABC transporter, permease protein PhnE [Candidatus Nitrosotalea sp.]|nr:phosphonate ABC transporter, permease protein PhnE [Candidatus Nitrosotalea sp.]